MNNEIKELADSEYKYLEILIDRLALYGTSKLQVNFPIGKITFEIKGAINESNNSNSN